MQQFWSGRGVTDGAIMDILVKRAAEVGGIWTDPPTLSARLDALEQMLSLKPAQYGKLLENHANVLNYRPKTIKQKLHTLSRLLPRADVLDMAARCPNLLCRAPDSLDQRVAAVKASLPRRDMEELIEEYPFLLLVSPPELEKRARAIRRSYVPETISGWTLERAAGALSRTTSKRLERLQVLEALNPSLRIAIPDRKILQMRDKSWQLHFLQKKNSRWRWGNTVRPEPIPRNFSPLQGTALPGKGNLLKFGKRVLEARLKEEEEAKAQQRQQPRLGTGSRSPTRAELRPSRSEEAAALPVARMSRPPGPSRRGPRGRSLRVRSLAEAVASRSKSSRL